MNQTERLPLARGVRAQAVTYAYYAAFIGLGLISASLGPTLPALAAQTQSDLRAASMLFTARATGYMLGALLGGRLYDALRGHPLMAASLLLMGAGMLAAPVVPLLWLLLAVLLLIGLGEGMLDVGGNTLLVWVHRSRVGPYMNVLHFCFGLGAFISPIIIAQAMLATDGIHLAYWLLAACVAPVVIGLLRLESPDASTGRRSTESSETAPAVGSVTNRPLALLIAFFMFLYVGAEVGIGGWIYTYAVALDIADATRAAYLTSLFWGALTAGRLLGMPLASRWRPRTILVVDLAGCVLSVGLMLMLSDVAWAIWLGTATVGLSMASIFPTVLTWAERRMTMNGSITSWFLVGASLGAMFLPWFIGQLFEGRGPQITMVIVLSDLLVAIAVFAGLMIFGGEPRVGDD